MVFRIHISIIKIKVLKSIFNKLNSYLILGLYVHIIISLRVRSIPWGGGYTVRSTRQNKYCDFFKTSDITFKVAIFKNVPNKVN